MYLALFLLLGVIFILFYLFLKEKNKNKQVNEINNKIQQKNEEILDKNKDLVTQQDYLQKDLEQKQKMLDKIQQSIEQSELTSKKAFENYVDILDKEYFAKEKEYQEAINLLNQSYGKIQDKINAEIDQIRLDLDKISSTRAAAIEAQRKEKIIKENKKKFSLNIDDMYKNDISLLERIKKDFSNPRIISMLIWQTYFRDPMSELCDYILGAKVVCGVYKITNQLTDECYIGQSVDVAKRWKDHVKCGLDIDRPYNNKLYQAMREDQIWNFTFELLIACPQSELNEKERYFINLYQSDIYGYNSNKGIKNT